MSHNLSAVKDLCHTAVVLDRGQVTFRGPVGTGIAHYTAAVASRDAEQGHGAGWSGLGPAGAATADGWRIEPGDPIAFQGRLELAAAVASGRLFLLAEDAGGTLVVHQRVELDALASMPLAPGAFDVTGALPPLWLAPGLYNVHLKFVGRTLDGRDVKYVSERQLLDVYGWSNEHARALLAPVCAWAVQDSVTPAAASTA